MSNPATSFAKEPDLNKHGKFVNYGQCEEFAEASDFDKLIEAELIGNLKI